MDRIITGSVGSSRDYHGTVYLKAHDHSFFVLYFSPTGPKYAWEYNNGSLLLQLPPPAMS